MAIQTAAVRLSPVLTAEGPEAKTAAVRLSPVLTAEGPEAKTAAVRLSPIITATGPEARTSSVRLSPILVGPLTPLSTGYARQGAGLCAVLQGAQLPPLQGVSRAQG